MAHYKYNSNLIRMREPNSFPQLLTPLTSSNNSLTLKQANAGMPPLEDKDWLSSHLKYPKQAVELVLQEITRVRHPNNLFLRLTKSKVRFFKDPMFRHQKVNIHPINKSTFSPQRPKSRNKGKLQLKPLPSFWRKSFTSLKKFWLSYNVQGDSVRSLRPSSMQLSHVSNLSIEVARL